MTQPRVPDGPDAGVLRSGWSALGCRVELLSAGAGPSRHEAAVDRMRIELDAIDRQASRFRGDSELSGVNRGVGDWHRVSAGFLDLVQDSLAAAHWTDGLVVPTLGRPLSVLGYDRDITLTTMQSSGPGDRRSVTDWADPAAAQGWREIEIDRDPSGPGRIRVPAGVALDLGSIGKASAADRIARLLARTALRGQRGLVNLGGDLSVLPDSDSSSAGPLRWEVAIDESGRDDPRTPRTSVRIGGGGLATSSTAVRIWSQHGARRHHILDPRTGLPARPCWRTVSVHADTARMANAASTAAVVLADHAPDWLAARDLTARLMCSDADRRRPGEVVLLGGWPADVTPHATADLTEVTGGTGVAAA